MLPQHLLNFFPVASHFWFLGIFWFGYLFIKQFINNQKDIPPSIKKDTKEAEQIIHTLNPYLKTKVNVKLNKKNGGILNIHFSSLKELISIIKKIKNEQ